MSIANLVRQGKFSEALGVAQVGLEDTRSQFFQDMEAQRKVLFGSSEAPADYFRQGSGFTPVQIKSGSGTGTSTTKNKTPVQVSADVLRLTKQINKARLAGNRLAEVDLGYDLAIQQLKEEGHTGTTLSLRKANLLTQYTLDRLDAVNGLAEPRKTI